MLSNIAKFRMHIDSYYIFKLKLLFILSRDCHLLSYSNCCFHHRSTVTILDTLLNTYIYYSRAKRQTCPLFRIHYEKEVINIVLQQTNSISFCECIQNVSYWPKKNKHFQTKLTFFSHHCQVVYIQYLKRLI